MLTMTRRKLGLASGMAAAVALSAGALIAFSAEASPAAEPGETAPNFTGTTSDGETVSLSDFSGQTVVLEWTNDGCPFVQKHYSNPPKNMQSLQDEAEADEVVWLQIISSAPGKQGHVSGEKADAINAGRDATPDHVILDPSGDIGRLYDAKTTPHMFVIKGDQQIAYAGAIDSIRSARVEDIDRADNYVRAALDAVEAGEPVEVASSKPYGCSVKY
ncbi:redoxin domain-containing protein [Henriciella aquimarina]|uniref:redoxin domain-containing protein n=1 Tax=Henriciella aquimarina TaxID=545261 RepID=UPI000A056F50|nr:redoxin domain-containing protein [Henriciella aquimarina]